MAVQDWSTTPAHNLAIDGLNIAEGCPPANINNALRAIMASVRVMYSNVPSTTNFVQRSGGTFATNPTFQGRGGYLHHSNPANVGGRIIIQPVGSAVPDLVNGDVLLEY